MKLEIFLRVCLRESNAKKCKNHLTSSSESQLFTCLVVCAFWVCFVLLYVDILKIRLVFPSLLFYWISIIVWKVEIKCAKKKKQNHLNVMLCRKKLSIINFWWISFYASLSMCMYVYLCKEEKDRGRVNGWIK